MTRMFYPKTGTLEEWNAAYYRLEDYFRAHHFINKVHQSQIILRLLQRAAARHSLEPDKAPTQLALEEAWAVMEHWFQQLLPDQPPARVPIVGRVSMQMIDATVRWPKVFLAEEEDLPPEFRAALRETSVRSGPHLHVSSMVPRPLDASPMAELLEENWERLGRMSLGLLIGLMALVTGAAFFYFY